MRLHRCCGCHTITQVYGAGTSVAENPFKTRHQRIRVFSKGQIRVGGVEWGFQWGVTKSWSRMRNIIINADTIFDVNPMSDFAVNARKLKKCDGRSWDCLWSGPRFNIKMTSYQYRKSHCGDKTILRPSYLHNGIFHAGKMTSLYWIRAQGGVSKTPMSS